MKLKRRHEKATPQYIDGESETKSLEAVQQCSHTRLFDTIYPTQNSSQRNRLSMINTTRTHRNYPRDLNTQYFVAERYYQNNLFASERIKSVYDTKEVHSAMRNMTPAHKLQVERQYI